MSIVTRRLSAALIAAAVFATLSIEPAFAQYSPGAPVGPAGGVGSTTAPSNSQGTPSGGTGTLSTTRVGPSTTAEQPAAVRAAPTRHRARELRRHRHHRRHHRAAQTGAQSMDGNGAVAPASR